MGALHGRRLRVFAARILALAFCAAALVAMAACDDGDGAASTPTPTPTAAANGPGGAAPNGEAVDAGVEWGDCRFDVPAGVDAECGDLTVPADRADPDAGTVRLHFAVLRSPEAAADAAPVVYLSGGPGGAALETLSFTFRTLFAPLLVDRDVIVFDQRGVGLSEPALRCEEYQDAQHQALQERMGAKEAAELALDALDACLGRLVSSGIDLSHYNSVASAADIEDLRQALGYDEWNLFGVSYGSRLALEVMRSYPDGLRSVILDSAYPPDADLYANVVANTETAINGFFAACAAHANCGRHYPDLEETFYDLVDRLNEEPAELDVVNPLAGSSMESVLTGDDLVGMLVLSFYSTELLALMPEIITAADAGDVEILGLLRGATMAEQEYVSVGMMLAVQCQEAVPLSDREAAATVQNERLAAVLEANVALSAYESCAPWDAGALPPGAGEAVSSDIPALILAGSLDHVTPPEWGRQAAATLPNSYFYEFADTGHSVLAYRECATGIAQAFLRDPRAEPDAACVEDLPPLAFTVDDVSVELTPFQGSGFRGVRPEGWTEVQPGVYAQSLFVTLTQMVQPGIVPRQQMLQLIAAFLGLDEPPEVTQTITTETGEWDVHEYVAFGRAGALAFAEAEGRLLLIEVNSTRARWEAYREQVLVPAIEAFELQ